MAPDASGGGEDGGASFEERLLRLEAIVREMEGENLELDAALRLFEEGVGHLRAARHVLRQAELRVEELIEESFAEPAVAPDPPDPPGPRIPEERER